MSGSVDTPVTEVRATEEQRLPARRVDLGRAARLGLAAGVVAVFVAAIGMVQTFDGRELIGDLSLGYALLLAVPLVFGYLASRPPPVLEGYELTRAGLRNLLAGLVAGCLAGVTTAVFVLVVGNLNVRAIFTNISPEMVELLSFRQKLLTGSALLIATNVALACAGGVLHLIGSRWRRPLLGAVVWVLALALIQSLVSQLFRGLRIPSVAPLLYGPTGALRISGAVIVSVVAFVLYVVAGPRRRALKRRIETMPAKRRRRLLLVALAVLAGILLVLPQILGVFMSEVLNTAGIFLLMALGLNIVVGLAGLLDLGYVAFFAVGAYTTAILTSPISPKISPEMIFWVALPFVVMAAAVSGIMVGTPVLRMRGDYLAIVTLGFGEIARVLFLSDWLEPIFGAARGIRQVGDINIGPVEVAGPRSLFYVVIVFVLLAAYVSYAVQDSRMGRAWMAIREDESVAEAMGVNIISAKLWAFIIGAILAGLGGALFAVKIGSVFPHTFEIIVSITVLVLVIVGGMASVPGVIVGSLVLIGLPEILREFEQYRFLIYGALLIIMMVRRPEGFIPHRRRARELHEEEVLQDSWVREQAAAGLEPGRAGGA